MYSPQRNRELKQTAHSLVMYFIYKIAYIQATVYPSSNPAHFAHYVTAHKSHLMCILANPTGNSADIRAI